jgi:hypothetical protein
VATGIEKTEPLCSECDPKIGKWHGEFKKESATGYILSSDGYLYTQKEWDENRPNHGDATIEEIIGE